MSFAASDGAVDSVDTSVSHPIDAQEPSCAASTADNDPLRDFAKALDAKPPTFSFEIVDLMAATSIPTTRLGELRALLTNERVRCLLLSECVAIVAHAELLKRLAIVSFGSTAQRLCADFLNELCGLSDGSATFWREVLLLRLMQNFAGLLSPDEASDHALVQRRVLLFQVLRSLLSHRTGISLAPGVLESLVRHAAIGRESDASASDAVADFRVAEADVDAASARRLQGLVNGETPKESVDWTAMILLVDDQSDKERLHDIVEHGRVMRTSIAEPIAVPPAPEVTVSAPPPALDDEWHVVDDAAATATGAATSETSPKKSPKLDSLKTRLAGFKLGLLGVAQSLKR